MTREDIVAVAGSLEDRFVVEIMETGADRAELVEALSRSRGDAPGLSVAPAPMSATVSRLCAIIDAADAAVADPLEWEEDLL
jgi:hypothetical protein